MRRLLSSVVGDGGEASIPRPNSTEPPQAAAILNNSRHDHSSIPIFVGPDRSLMDSSRESMENSVPAVSRNSRAIAQADVLSFFRCLPFDSKSLASDCKSIRQGELKRSVAVALGFPPDSLSNITSKGKPPASPSQEEIKRLKLSLRECSGKARERVRTFTEALSLMSNCFPSLSSKKRSRPDCFSNDRLILRQGPGKTGSQSNIMASGFEHQLPKSEERTKKRTRTSLVDAKVQGQVPMRPSWPVDRERNLQKLAHSSSAQYDDRTMPLGVDGWDKTKTKKKRSGIKPDVTSTTISAKLVDSNQELKQGNHQRLTNDARPRLNSDVPGLIRHGFINGALGVGKSGFISQETSSNACVPSSKVDNDGSSLPVDRKYRPMNSDKEKLNHKATKKINGRDDFNSASPTSGTRMNASVRGPRATSCVMPKLSQVMNRAISSNDSEIPHPTSGPSSALGSNNRKRAASVQSSSPPTSQWTRQHQKTSRTGRRTNLGPSVSSNDEASPLDTTCDVGGNDRGFPRRLSANSPQLVKLKGDILSSSTISEGEDSGATEIKSRVRGKKFDEVDQKSGQYAQKVSNLAVPSRKHKLVFGEDRKNAVRRQGRNGRGFTSARSLLPAHGEKLGNGEHAKQLRTAKPGPDKSESKASRPPTRKLSDRKSYARQRHRSINTAADFLAGSGNEHDELLTAANAVVNPTLDSPKSLWKEMEPLFGYISDIDINYLKEQGHFGSAFLSSKLDFLVDKDGLGSSQTGFMSSEGEGGTEAEDLSRVSLFERCLAALIPEDETSTISENDELRNDAYGSSHELYDDLDSNGFTYQPSYQSGSALNDYMVASTPEFPEHVTNASSTVRMGGNSMDGFPVNDLLTNQPSIPSLASDQSLYESIGINEKLLLEFQSVATSPEAMDRMERGESAGIAEEIDQLMHKYHGQVAKKRVMLDRTLKSSLEMKESQEREFEQLALDNLVAMAYDKYMVCWCPAGVRSASSKMAKQASLAFVRRTLNRCRQFEETGKSCFSDPSFKEIFHSGSSRLSLARITASKNAESRSMSSLGQMDQHDMNSSDMLNHLPEQDKEVAWPNRVKKRELLLEEVVGGNSFSSPLTSSTKGKRSERDREGKALSGAGNTKTGRSAASSAKGERKSKAKPKQKVQLSVSINGLVGNSSEQAKPATVSSTKMTAANTKVEYGMEELEEPLDFSQLQLPGIDDLGVSADDFGGQGQDLACWLNIDDDNLQDQDFMGLEIPMDDLTDLNMMV